MKLLSQLGHFISHNHLHYANYCIITITRLSGALLNLFLSNGLLRVHKLELYF